MSNYQRRLQISFTIVARLDKPPDGLSFTRYILWY